MERTSPCQLYFPIPNSSRLTVNRRPLSEEDRWDFEPVKGKISLQCGDGGGALMDGETTYTDCGKDILQLVYQRNKLGVVDINPVRNFS